MDIQDSDYKRRGYRSVHVKEATHRRLMVAILQKQIAENKHVRQDDFVSELLDHYDKTAPKNNARSVEYA